ncbi:DUF4199 domain-containing protein [Flagellimonas allohymeniacidonis]|uniref:DUF4199 domain-containing protein n=1 Tax=Flagellimonas allohymeniacidonis TaxID=2517819 RepID=A0A4Q8QAG4_9FLAO|nr:DUF4199 domain-containing protein [Allomuricauda hymeniacidonis]TAI47231.1 DUF4199 domain-containing protein [Allomuricauda hymeniacidonis]
MKKTVIRYGTYGAICISVLFLLSWTLLSEFPLATQEVLGYAAMIVSLGFVFFGIKHFRDHENDGKVSFKKALTIGVLISLITALVFGVLDIFYTEVLNPEFMDSYYEQTAKKMEETLSAEEFKVKLTELEAQKEMFGNPLFSFLLMAMTVFVIGFIISLISSLILQRK